VPHIYNKIAQVFYRLAYRALLSLWFFTRPTVSGVYIAIWHNETLLMIKNSYKKRITIPCGRIKRGEDLAAAAVRELDEEVGIQLEKNQLTFVGEYTAEFKYATDIGTFFEIDMAEPPKVQVDNREVVWAQFMPLDQVSDLNLNPTVEVWLKHRLAPLSKNVPTQEHCA
jgi:8-oxo-dGTP pyrophosphatase MutT (NUDIX family)